MPDYIFVLKLHFAGARMIQAVIEFLVITFAVAAGRALFEVVHQKLKKKRIYIKKTCAPCDCGCECCGNGCFCPKLGTCCDKCKSCKGCGLTKNCCKCFKIHGEPCSCCPDHQCCEGCKCEACLAT